MADVPSPLYKLNYPVETEAAYKFWSSNHKSNKVKAIIAFSLNLDNANDNLRRYGYALQFRERALKNFCMYVNNPSMSGVPYTEMTTPWYIDMPYRETSLCSIVPPEPVAPDPINFMVNTLDSRVSYTGPASHAYLTQGGLIAFANSSEWPLEFLNGSAVGRSLPEPARTNFIADTRFNSVSAAGGGGNWITAGQASSTGNSSGVDGGPARINNFNWTKFGVYQITGASWLQQDTVVPSSKVLGNGWTRFYYSASPTQNSQVRYYTARGDSGNYLYTVVDGTSGVSQIFSVFRNTNTSANVMASLPMVESGQYSTSPISSATDGATRAASSVVINSENAASATLTFSDGSTKTISGLSGTLTLPFADYDWATKFLTGVTFSL